MKNGHFRDDEAASKRAADTGVLLAEIVLNKPSSTRAVTAIARMNQLHAPYQRSGQISNDDLLYTLSLFALEPSRWVSKLERRQLTDLELCAIGTYWKSLGDAMSINYAALPRHDRWTDGLDWLQELERWSVQYEKDHMVAAESNKLLAENTINVLLWNVPCRLKPRGKQLVSVLLGDRLRQAMMYSPRPARTQRLQANLHTGSKHPQSGLFVSSTPSSPSANS